MAQEAQKFMRHAKRTTLMPQDVDYALQALNVQVSFEVGIRVFLHEPRTGSLCTHKGARSSLALFSRALWTVRLLALYLLVFAGAAYAFPPRLTRLMQHLSVTAHSFQTFLFQLTDTSLAFSLSCTHHIRCTNHPSFPSTLPILPRDPTQLHPLRNNPNFTFSETRKSILFPTSRAFTRLQEAPPPTVNIFRSVMLQSGARMPVSGGKRIGWPLRVSNRLSRRTLSLRSKTTAQEQA